MATKTKPKVYTHETFISTFNSIAHHKHRYEVFKDFVILSAIELHNSTCKLDSLEQEYIAIVRKYSEAEFKKFCELFVNFLDLIQEKPVDVIGQLYMELELGNNHTGQFFSPPEISQLMAKMVFSGVAEKLETKPFITLSEPACGAGGMVLAFVNEMISQKINPADRLFVQCIDIDRLAALMCYMQLSFWGVPAQIIVGDTLTGKYRENYYTPVFYWHNWDSRLKWLRIMDFIREMETPQPNQHDAVKPTNTETQTKTNTQQATKTKTNVADGLLHQVDLLSEFDLKIDH